MSVKEAELQEMLQQQRINQLSSDEERQQIGSKSQNRKPIRDPFSEQESSDSDIGFETTGLSPFPPKQPKQKTVLEQAQQNMKWNKDDELETEILAKLEGQGMKDKKIRELAQKYKGLNVAYEKEKTIRKNLEGQLNSFIKTNQRSNSIDKERTKSIEKTKNMDKSLMKTDSKCGGCHELDKKVMDMRVKNQNLKSELNKAHRVISREIGENFNIDQVLNEDNHWKGRQQKIEKLKIRVKDLEEKLQNVGINVSQMTGFTQLTAGNKTNLGFSSTQKSSAIADNKRKQFDNLKVQVQALKSQNQLLQSKMRSFASRKTVVQNELKDCKAEFERKKNLLVEKSENDDKLISLLKAENEKLKKEERVITKVIYKEGKEGREDEALSTLKKENQDLKRKVLSLKRAQQKSNDIMQKQVKQPKTLNGIPRQFSSDKRDQIQNQYVTSNKYLKKMSAQEEEEIYKAWKQGKKI